MGDPLELIAVAGARRAVEEDVPERRRAGLLRHEERREPPGAGAYSAGERAGDAAIAAGTAEACVVNPTTTPA